MKITIRSMLTRLFGLCLFLVASYAHAETWFEIGANIVSSEFSDSTTLILQERWRGQYALSFGYISEQNIDTCGRVDCKWDVQEQFIIGAERIFSTENRFGDWEFALGPYYFSSEGRISACRLLVRLTAARRLFRDWWLKLSHFSNAGTCDDLTLVNPNDTRGPEPVPITSKWNLGQDGIFITGRFGE